MIKTWLEVWTDGTFYGTDDSDSLSSHNAFTTLVGGAGDDFYSICEQTNIVVEAPGGGIDTVTVWTWEGYRLPANIENLTLADATNAWGFGNELANSIIGTTGNNLIDGMAGNDLLTGGAGYDTFVIRAGGGSDVITDFDPRYDTIRLEGFHYDSFSQLSGNLKAVGADTVLRLSSGETLTFKNLAPSALDQDHFALPISKLGMVQTFGDDFESFSVSGACGGTWSTNYVWGGDGAYFLPANAEQQCYVDPEFRGLTDTKAADALGLNPFSVGDGSLTITARPVDDASRPYVGDQAFTSGVITTADSFSQTYGYFEMTAELPDVAGAWPAFWLLPTDNSWPPELDIMEAKGGSGEEISHNLFSTDSSANAQAWAGVDGLFSGKHSFGALWTPYDVTFYVDGQETMRVATPQDFNKPMYLIANLAMGGHWPGDADPSASAEMKIDSINVYQLQEYTLAGYSLRSSGAYQVQARSGSGTDKNDLFNNVKGTLTGGFGDDLYRVSASGTKIVEKVGQGVDTVESSASFVLPAYVENLVLTGKGNTNATGNQLANIITGNAGANVLKGGGGGDILTGGLGADRFVIARGDGSDIITDFQAGKDKVQLSGFAFTSFGEIREALSQVGKDVHLALTTEDTLVFRGVSLSTLSAADFLLPTTPAHSADPIRWVIGTAASETLYGSGAHSEYLQGEGGSDILIGGRGDDLYDVFSGVQIIEKAGEGIDTAIAWSDYQLPDFVENITLKVAGTATGNSRGNLLLGSDGNDTLRGLGGNDWLDGGAGQDVLEGGDGDDTYILHANDPDRIVDTGGIDTIISDTSINLRLFSGIEKVQLRGSVVPQAMAAPSLETADAPTASQLSSLFGNELNNVLTGNGLDNLLDGGEGNDQLEGGDGDDIYIVDSKFDFVSERGSSGRDEVRSSVNFDLSDSAQAAGKVEALQLLGAKSLSAWGNEWANELTGNSGDNRLFGRGGADLLNGGKGNDRIEGGAGADVLTGGGGRDYFVFTRMSESSKSAPDRISDFKSGADLIDLREIDANPHRSGNQAFHLVSAFTGHAAELTSSFVDGRTVVSLDANGDGRSDARIELLGHYSLSSADFLL